MELEFDYFGDFLEFKIILRKRFYIENSNFNWENSNWRIEEIRKKSNSKSKSKWTVNFWNLQEIVVNSKRNQKCCKRNQNMTLKILKIKTVIEIKKSNSSAHFLVHFPEFLAFFSFPSTPPPPSLPQPHVARFVAGCLVDGWLFLMDFTASGKLLVSSSRYDFVFSKPCLIEWDRAFRSRSARAENATRRSARPARRL